MTMLKTHLTPRYMFLREKKMRQPLRSKKKYNNKYSNNNNQQKNKDSKKKKLTNKDKCPIHGLRHEWGSPTKISTAKTFALVEPQDHPLPILLIKILTDLPFTMDCPLRYKSIPTKIDPFYLIPVTTLGVKGVILHQHDILHLFPCLPLIRKIKIIEIECQSNVSTMKLKTQ